MKKLFLASVLSSLMFAAGPFGLNIGKSNVEDVKKLDCKYRESYLIDGVYPNDGRFLSFENCHLMDNLKNAEFAFDDDGILVYVRLIFDDKNSYNELKTSLNKKYKITKSVEPFVGDRLSEYALKGEKIKLNSPHMSFSVYLEYEQNDFSKRVKKAQQKAKEQKQNATTNML